MDPGINNILEQKENVVWQGVINRKVIGFVFIFTIIITLIISGVLFSMETINYTSNGQPKQTSGALIGGIILAIGLLISVSTYFMNKVIEYAITKKRVIIKSGLIGTDFKSIYFDQIQNVIVDVGIIGKVFNVGTIKIDTGKTDTYSTGGGSNRGQGGFRSNSVRTRTMYDFLKHIDQPYEVYKYFQSSLSNRKESLYSGRADRESNPQVYK